MNKISHTILITLLFLFLAIVPANADVIDINGQVYATEDSIVVHCADGKFRELMSLSMAETNYILGRSGINSIQLNGKTYLNLTTLSQNLLAEGKNEYVIPKTNKDNFAIKAGKSAVKNYVYNGSEYDMKRGANNRYYIQNTIGKTEDLAETFNSSSISTWEKIRRALNAFGY